MSRTRYSKTLAGLVLLTLVALPAGRAIAAAPDPGDSPQQKEQSLIRVLRSDAPPAEKAIACKRLAIYGTGKAVPALAPLLADKELSSWARIALEAIPDPAADEALRQAAGQLRGRLLTGVINSLGYRRDSKAAAMLTEKLRDSDEEVACAAAAALGKIGSEQAAAALQQCLTAQSRAVRSAAAEACVLCAEARLAAGDRHRAIGIYEAVRKADVPRPRIVEATRGAILARQSAGIPLLLEVLRSSDRQLLGIGLRAARELPGSEVTDALVAELGRSPEDRQVLLIHVLGDRADARALPAVVESLKSGPGPVRIAAANVLEKLGDVSCVPALLEAAGSDNQELSQAAKTTLARLPDQRVDPEILSRLQRSSGQSCRVLIELAEQRRIDGAADLFARYAQDPDASVRAAALVALGATGSDRHIPELVSILLKTSDAAARAEIEKAITAISARGGSACVQYLLPLLRSPNGPDRVAALRGLVCCGGPESLAAVKAAIGDTDEAVQDEAVRTLSTWPNRWPDDAAVAQPLLDLARSARKTSHQVLGIRGYLTHVQNAGKLAKEEKLAAVNLILPLIKRPEEKRQAISVLGAIGTAGALKGLQGFAADATVADEACSAIVNLIRRRPPGLSGEERRAALQTVVERSPNQDTRRRAEELLKASF